MSTATEKAVNIFQIHQGVLHTSQALALGIAPRVLYSLRDQGLISPLSRGVYFLTSRGQMMNPDLVKVALRIPKAVVCLNSAAHYYQLIAGLPSQVFIALPKSAEKPRLDHPNLHITWLSSTPYALGVSFIDVDGFGLPIYNREKTVADCFKFRNKIGLPIALEALKNYLALADCRLDELLKYARSNREMNVMTRYLEILQ